MFYLYFLITLFLAIGFLSNNNIKALNIEGEDKIVIEENSSEEIFYKISNLDKESKFALYIQYDKENKSSPLNLQKDQEIHSYLKLKKTARGIYENQKVRLYSTYPLGLFYAWRIFDVKQDIYVYPSPKIFISETEKGSVENDSNEAKEENGELEFDSHKKIISKEIPLEELIGSYTPKQKN